MKRPFWKRAATRAREVVSNLPSTVDEAIYAAFPTWGARRIATRAQLRMARKAEEVFNRAWSGAESDRTHANKWLSSRLSPDSELELDHRTLQERCDELYRDNSIAHGAVEGRIAHEVGTGIMPQSRIEPGNGLDQEGAKALNAALEEVCSLWSEAGVDRSGTHSLVAFEKLLDRNFASLGEAFIEVGDLRKPRNGSPIPMVLDCIHPFRVATPPQKSGDPLCRLGVQMTDAGEVQGYWVQRTHPYDTRKVDLTFDFVPRFDRDGRPRMLHVFEPLFAGQHRGLPWLAATINRLKDVQDMVEYTLVAMQVEACFSAFIHDEGGASPHAKAAAASSGYDAAGSRIEELRPGSVEYLGKGQSIEFAQPARPGNTFLPMVEWSLRSIAASLNYPYELLAANFARVTFSSGRLSMMAGRLGFNMRRQTLVEKALSPIWKQLVHEAILTGSVRQLVDAFTYARNASRFYRHIWQSRTGVIHVNPEQEWKAHKLAVTEDFKTQAEVWAEEGKDWEQGMVQRGREKELRVRQHTHLEKIQAELREQLGLPPLPAGIVAGLDEVKSGITGTATLGDDTEPPDAEPDPETMDQGGE